MSPNSLPYDSLRIDMLDLLRQLRERAAYHHQCQQAPFGHQLQMDPMEHLLRLTINQSAVWVLLQQHIHRELCKRAPRSLLRRNKRCLMDLHHTSDISHRAKKDRGVDNRHVKDQIIVALVLRLLGRQALVRTCIINSHNREAILVLHRKATKADPHLKVVTLIVPSLPTPINNKLVLAQTQTIALPMALFEVRVLL